MPRTLHYVVRVTVPDDTPQALIRDRMEKNLLGYTIPVTVRRLRFHELRVWRPRGKLGVLLRELDQGTKY